VLQRYVQIRFGRRIRTLAVCPDVFESRFRSLEQHHRWLPVLTAIVRKLNGSLYRFSLRRKDSLQVLGFNRPPAPALKYDELGERAHLVEPAEKTAAHSTSVTVLSKHPPELYVPRIRQSAADTQGVVAHAELGTVADRWRFGILVFLAPN
jgi:hypothetical protein